MTQGARSTGDVVVGVDGSNASLRAVDWAAAEAATRGNPLVVCCVAVAGSDDRPMLWDGQQLILVPAHDVVGRATAPAQEFSSDLPVSGAVLRGDPTQQLL